MSSVFAGCLLPLALVVVEPAAPDVEAKRAWSVEHVPGLGIKAESPGGEFALQMWLRGQLRYTLSRTVADGQVDTNQVFQLRRGSVFFAGHTFGEHNKYFVQLVFAPQDLGLQNGQVTQSPIFDWFLTFDHLRDASVRVGQYKPFYSRQFIAPWGELQFVDRSTVQSEFLLERDLGLDVFSDDLGGKDGIVHYSIGAYFGQGRTSFQPRPFAMTYVARLEVRPFGDFDAYRYADLARQPTPKLAIGAAYAYQDRASRDRGASGDVPADGGTTSFHDVVADTIFKFYGWSIAAEFFWRDGDRHPGDAVDDMGVPIDPVQARSGIGWFAQGGWLVPRVPFEIVARGGEIFGSRQSSLPDGGEVGGGLNYYFHEHMMKLQIDYFRLWSGVPIDDGNDQVRLQLQVSM